MSVPTAGAAPLTLERFEAGDLSPECFSHRDHVRMGYELARRAPFTEAVDRFARALRAMTVRAGHPEKYHDTITVAFMSLIAERLEGHTDFDAFAEANPELFEKDVLLRRYTAERLMSAQARRSFLLP